MNYLDHDVDNYSMSVAPAAPAWMAIPLDGIGITMTIIYLAVCTVGLAGNILVMVAILKLDKMASATTVYIFNLALADGLFMVSLPFVAIQNFRHEWVFGELFCKLFMVLDAMNQFTSVFILTAMSVDRYMALVDPLRFAHWRTPRNAKVVSAVLWLFSLVPVLPMALHVSVYQGACTLTPPPGSDPRIWMLAFISYTFVLGFLLPFTLMSASYASLVYTMRSQRLRQRYRQVGAGTSPSLESHRLEKQVTKMVVAVVVVFGVCWIPFYTFNFYSVFANDVANFARAFEFAVLLSYAWSCANPILYACFSDTFRCYFRTLLFPAQPNVDHHSNAAVTERYNLTDADGRDGSVVMRQSRSH